MEQDWKQLKLSLEAPSKDDEGNKIPRILDIQDDTPIFDEFVHHHHSNSKSEYYGY